MKRRGMTVSRLTLFCGVVVMLLAAVTVQAAVTDAPHNDSHGITCSSCHSYSLWWAYSPVQQDSNFEALSGAVCATCHNGTDAPSVTTHSSFAINSTNHAPWGRGCTDCHDPHMQGQLEWATAPTGGPYLVTGTINSITNAGSGADATSTITYSAATTNGNWPVASWFNKSVANSNRGLILVQDTTVKANTFSILTADASTIVIKGTLAPSSIEDPHPATRTTFGLIFGDLIRDSVKYKNVSGTMVPMAVKLFDPKTDGAFVEVVAEGSTPTGICQVCHVNTLRYKNDGAMPSGEDTHVLRSKDCTGCHLHTEGFKSRGHDSQYFIWDADLCSTCHGTGSEAPTMQSTHVMGVTSSCLSCHAATTAPFNVAPDVHSAKGCQNCHNSTGALIGSAAGKLGVPDKTCLTCHVTAEADSEGFHHATADYATGNCRLCHDPAGHSVDTTLTDLAQGTPGTLCATCHEVANYDEILATHAGVCVTCHEATRLTGNPVNAAETVADVISAKAQTDCMACHWDKLSPLTHSCGTCHATDRASDAATAHDMTASLATYTVTDISTTIDPDPAVTDRLQVSFQVEDNGAPFTTLANTAVRATIAKLVPGSNGSPSTWVNYINVFSNSAATNGTQRTPTSTNATSTKNGVTTYGNQTLTHNGDGNYTLTFTAPTSGVDNSDVKHNLIGGKFAWEPSLTHRVGLQFSGKITNAWYDFVPNGGPVTTTRDIVANASCSSCHEKLGLHGGGRYAPEYCVTCHTEEASYPNGEAAVDANGDFVQPAPPAALTNTWVVDGLSMVDFPVMIHKIHMGNKLTRTGYNIKGVLANEITYPQEAINCRKCHNNDTGINQTADGDNWKNKPSRKACAACHDKVSFASATPSFGTAHTGGVQANDYGCIVCHAADKVESYHANINDTVNNPSVPAGAVNFTYEISEVTVDGSNKPVVKFRINQDGAPVTSFVAGSAPLTGFTGAPGFLVAYALPQDGIDAPADFNTLDNIAANAAGNDPSQPKSISINTLALNTLTPDAEGYYTATLNTVLPDNATMRTVALQGYFTQALGTNGIAAATARHAVSAVKTVTGDAERRQIVDAAKCANCHEYFEGHGGNRNFSADTTGTIVCVLCHNPNVSSNGRTGDINQPEASNNFKDMIHGIHASAIRDGVKGEKFEFARFRSGTLYPYDWSEVTFPANVKSCTLCHKPGTFDVDGIPATALKSTTFTTNGTNATTADVIAARRSFPNATDLVVDPVIATCTSCHAVLGGQNGHEAEARNTAGTTNPAPHGAGFSVLPFCEACHFYGITSRDVVVDIHANNCALCHLGAPGRENERSYATAANGTAAGKSWSAVDCGTCHGTDNYHQVNHFIAPGENCATCHSTIVANPHVNHPGGCATCHSSTRPDVVKTIFLRNPATNCMNCHAGYHGVSPASLHNVTAAGEAVVVSATNVGISVTSYDCDNCHHEDILAAHEGNCNTCHASSVLGIQQVMTAGLAGTPVTCESCHNATIVVPSGKPMYQYDGVRHHTTSHAQSGDCAFCHADPRGGFAGTMPGGAPMPQQMACRLCHTNYGTDGLGTPYKVDVKVSSDGSGITTRDADVKMYPVNGPVTHGLTVFKNDYDAKGATITPVVVSPNTLKAAVDERGNAVVQGPKKMVQSPIHRIESLSGTEMINVQNFGACLSCHTVQKLHGAPLEGVHYARPTNNFTHSVDELAFTDNGCSEMTATVDQLRYAPGYGVFNDMKGPGDIWNEGEGKDSAFNNHRLVGDFYHPPLIDLSVGELVNMRCVSNIDTNNVRHSMLSSKAKAAPGYPYDMGGVWMPTITDSYLTAVPNVDTVNSINPEFTGETAYVADLPVRTFDAPTSVNGVISFAAPVYAIQKPTTGSANVVLTVKRNGGSTDAVTVHYATSDDTAKISATDYTATSGDLTWAAGDTADKTISVPITGKAWVNAAASKRLDLKVTLTAPTGGAVLGSQPLAAAYIVEPVNTVVPYQAVTVTGNFVMADVTLKSTFAGTTVTDCEYTTDGSTWAAGVLGGGWSNGTTNVYTCTGYASGMTDGASVTLNTRATVDSVVTTATALTRTVDAAGPTDGILTVTPGAGQNLLVWTAASDGSGSGLLGGSKTYDVRAVMGDTPPAHCADGASIYVGDLLTATHANLNTDAHVSYRVCAYDKFGLLAYNGKDESFNVKTPTFMNISAGVTGSGVATTATAVTYSMIGDAGTNVGTETTDLGLYPSLALGNNVTKKTIFSENMSWNPLLTFPNSGTNATVREYITPGDHTLMQVYTPVIAGGKTITALAQKFSIKGGRTDDAVTLKLYDYNPVDGSRTLVAHTAAFNITAAAKAFTNAFTIDNGLVPDGHRLVMDIIYTPTVANSVKLIPAIYYGGVSALATGATETFIKVTMADYTGPATIALAAATNAVAEGDGTATITVKRTVGSSGAVSVDYATTDGTATAGSDYTATAGTLTWAAGDMADKTITVPVSNDAKPEADETVNVTLSNLTGNATLGTPASSVLTITNDDIAAPGTIALSSATYSVAENAGEMVVTATRIGGADGAVSVSYATADGTATAGSDYTAASGTLTWADDDTADKTFVVPISNDTVVDPDETVNLAITSATGGATLGTPNAALLTITWVDQHTVAQATSDLAQGEPGAVCTTCHAVNGFAAILSTHAGQCATCHEATRTTGNPAALTETVADIITANAQTDCLACHWNKQTPLTHSCGTCHTTERAVDATVAHDQSAFLAKYTVSDITPTFVDHDVNPDTADRFQVSFKVMDGATPVDNLTAAAVKAGAVRINLSKLVAASSGNPSYWANYIGTMTGSKPSTVSSIITGTTQNFFNDGNGDYRFILNGATGQDVKAPPVGARYTFDGAVTHRVAIQISSVNGGTVLKATNAWLDFVPNGGAVATTRNITTTGSCNSCHEKINVHGGGRYAPEYCVTCHTPDRSIGAVEPTVDAAGNFPVTLDTSTPPKSLNPTNVVDGVAQGDFPVLIHKIHMGKELTREGYYYGGVWFNEITYPQEQINCRKCHSGTGANAASDGDNWKNVPSRKACGACHDNISFAATPPAYATAHTGGAQASDYGCIVCHAAAKIETYHTNINDTVNNPNVPTGAVNFTYEIKSVTVDGSSKPVVTFRINQDGTPVTSWVAGSAPLTGFTGAPGFLVAYTLPQDGIDAPADFNTLDNIAANAAGNDPSQPKSISINTLALNTLTPDGEGYYTATLNTVLPANATMRTVALQGYFTQALGTNGIAAATARHAVSAVKTVTGDAERRQIVDAAKCANCHEYFEGHGGNRNISADTTGTIVCVLCHNPNVSSNGRTGDVNQPEASNNFKDMIHGIHASAIRDGVKGEKFEFARYRSGALYPYDWSEVTFPANVKSCTLCHKPGTFDVATIPAAALSTTTFTTNGTNTATTDVIAARRSFPNATDLIVDPMTATCTSCHALLGGQVGHNPAARSAAGTEPTIHGGGFSVTPSCGTCHVGSNVVADMHGNTCSLCHAVTATVAPNRNNEQSYATAANGTAAAGTWATVTCLTCHVEYQDPEVTVPHHATDNATSGNCGACHVEMQTEWAASGHGDPNGDAWIHYDWDGHDTTPAGTSRQACQRCHTATGSANYMSNPATYNPANNVYNLGVGQNEILTCNGCHTNSISNRQVPALASVTFPSGVTVNMGDTSNVCLTCHQGRSSTASVDAVIFPLTSLSRLGDPHHAAAGVTFYGSVTHGGYEYAGNTYSGQNTFSYHAADKQTCTGCHMQGDAKNHTMTPDVNACIACHGGTSFETLGGTPAQNKAEIEALASDLLTALNTYALANSKTGIESNGTSGFYKIGTQTAYNNAEVDAVMYKAIYNYLLLYNDAAAFIHNGAYMKELLYDSIMTLDAAATPSVARASNTTSCNVCHADRAAEALVAHDMSSVLNKYTVSAISATIDPDVAVNDRLVVNFTVMDGATPVTTLASKVGLVRANLAKLVPGANGSPSYWVNYINVTANTGIQRNPTTVASSATATANNMTLVHNGNGQYTATFIAPATGADTSDVKHNPFGGKSAWEPTLTHRVGLQISGSFTAVPPAAAVKVKTTNAWYDFVPAGGAVTDTRNITSLASCNSCHEQLSLHGGGRYAPEFCVTCHTDEASYATVPYGEAAVDANGDFVQPAVAPFTNTWQVDGWSMVDFPVMIHKIHMGNKLSRTGYNIKGVLANEITYPQEVINCRKCHNNDTGINQTADGGNWKTQPSRKACAACHDKVSFTTATPAFGTAHTGGVQLDDSICVTCHNAANIEEHHTNINNTTNNPNVPAGAVNFTYEIKEVTVDGSNKPVVTFRIKQDGTPVTSWVAGSNPLTGFTGAPGFLVAYALPQNGIAAPADFNTLDNMAANAAGNDTSQPKSISLNTLAMNTLTPDVDGYYTATLNTVFPAGATMRTIALQAYFTQAAGTNGLAVATGRHAVASVKTVTGDVVRRDIVDPAKCAGCHEYFEGHGGSRNISADTVGTVVCVLCHNPNVSSNGRTNDVNDPEASNNFKDMVHGIHASAIRDGVKGEKFEFVRFRSGTRYPFDWSEVTFPANAKSCTLCHKPGTFGVADIPATALSSTTFTTNGTNATPADVIAARRSFPNAADEVVQPLAAACTSCHALLGGQNGHGPAVRGSDASVVPAVQPHGAGFSFATCGTCHLGSDVVADVHGNNCSLCHTGKPSRNNEKSFAANANGTAAAGTWAEVNCSTCHIDQHLVLHGFTAAGQTVAVTGANVGLSVTAYSCANCHLADAITEHNGNCGTCHGTGIPDIEAVIAAGASGIPQTCESCHNDTINGGTGLGGLSLNSPTGKAMYQYDGVRHHTTNHAQMGDCTFCHVDPRPAVVGEAGSGWAATYGVTAPTEIPTQLACRICHTNYGVDGLGTKYSVSASVYQADGTTPILKELPVGPAVTSGLTVYANSYNGNKLGPVSAVGTMSNANFKRKGAISQLAQSQIHRIEPVTAGNMIQVNNYGACLGCHTVQKRHGSPAEGNFTKSTAQTGTAGCTDFTATFDTLRFAPGRGLFNDMVANGKAGGSGSGTSDNRQNKWNAKGLVNDFYQYSIYGSTTCVSANDTGGEGANNRSNHSIFKVATAIYGTAAGTVSGGGMLGSSNLLVPNIPAVNDFNPLYQGSYTGTEGAVTVTDNNKTVRIFPALATPNENGNISFTLAIATRLESDTNVSFNVTRTGSKGAVSMNWATVDGAAVAGNNFVANAGTLSWADGNTDTKTVTVTLNNDGVASASLKNFTIALSGETGGATVGDIPTATVTLQEVTDTTLGDPTGNQGWTIGAVTPSVGSAVSIPAAITLNATFSDPSSNIASCEYTTDGTTWAAGVVSGVYPTFTCTKTGITGLADTPTLNMRATSVLGTVATATAITPTVDATGPTVGTLTVTPADGANGLSWDAASDAGMGLRTGSSYVVRWISGGTTAPTCANGTVLYTGDATTYNHNDGLPVNVQANYTVCAYDAGNNGSAATMNGNGTITSGPAQYYGTMAANSTAIALPVAMTTVVSNATGTGRNWRPASAIATGPVEVVNMVSGVIDAAVDKTISAMTSKFSVQSNTAGDTWLFEVYASTDGVDETKLVATSTTPLAVPAAATATFPAMTVVGDGVVPAGSSLLTKVTYNSSVAGRPRMYVGAQGLTTESRISVTYAP